MSVFSFGDSPPHTPNEAFITHWDSDNDDTSNVNCDDFEPEKYDSSLDEADHIDYFDDGDKDDTSLDEDDRFDYDCEDDDGDNDDPFVSCRFCNKPVSSSFLNEHLNNQHKCNYCIDCGYMNADSLEAHIKEKHVVACKHCDAKKLFSELAQHELNLSQLWV